MSLRIGLRPLFVCAAAVVFSQAAFAQMKIAVVNLQNAVMSTAEITKANDEMQAKFKPQQDELNNLNTQMQQISSQLQTQGDKLSPQAAADLQANGQRLQREAQRKDQDLRDAVEAYRNEVLQKSSQKMSDVVKKLAEERGYDLVVDSQTTLFVKPAIDITKDVIAAYDKAYPVAAAPPATKK
jgi:outer membrane protein